MIYLPLCRDNHIFGRHGRGNRLIPADKGVTLSCRVGGSGNCRAVILCNGCNLTSAVCIKGDGVLIYLPLRRDNHIFGRHGRGNCLIPADEGVAFSCRVGRGGNRCAVVLCDGCNFAAAVGVKGNCVLIYLPLRRDCHVFGRHGRGNCLVPTDEGVTLFCRVGRGGDCCAVVLCNGCDGTTTCGVEGDGILIDLPLRPVFLIPHFGIADRHNRSAGQRLVIVPAGKGIALAGHIACCRERRALAVVVRGDIAAAERTAVFMQRHGISQGCPLRCQGSYTGGDHRSGDIALPITAQPPEIAVGVAARSGQPHAAGGGEAFAVLHNDIHRACGIANAAAV